MSANSSGPGKPVDGSSPGSFKPETGEVTEGNVGNACNNQTHSATHCAQCETNHTPIPAQTHSTDETHQDGASCHGDKGAKLGVQKEGLAEKVSNSEQTCMGKSYKKVVGTLSGSHEDSESSVEDEDQSDEVKSLGRKGGKQDKTPSEIYAGSQSDQAVQEVEKVNLDENHRAKCDTNKIPKGNEQMDNGNGAIQRGKEKKGKRHDKNDGFKDSDRRLGENEKDTGAGVIQVVEGGKHNHISGCKYTAERTSENEEEIQDGAIRRVIYDDDDNPAKRRTEYIRNGKGDKATKAMKGENPDVNKTVTDTKREPTEIEKNHNPDGATQTASVKKSQRSELYQKNYDSEMSGNTNDAKGKKESDKTRTGLAWDAEMEPSKVNTDGTYSTVSGKDDNGAMPGAIMSAIDNNRDSSLMENEGLSQIAITTTGQESQTDLEMLKKEFRETDKETIENEGNDQEDQRKPISQAGNMELSDKTASVQGNPDKSLGDSDGGTKEIKGVSTKTTPKTQTTQPDSQDKNHAYQQDETGATSSEPSHEILLSSQSQSDETILVEQLDWIIDELANDNKLYENLEEWKKIAKEKIKGAVFSKIREGTLSRKSFYPDVKHNKAVQSFDSDGTSTKEDDGGPRIDPVDDSGGFLSSQSQSSSPTTHADFLNANRGRVGTQSLHSTPGSSSRLSSQTGTEDAGGPRSDPVDESGGSLPPQSPSSKTGTKDAGGSRSDPVDGSGGSLPPQSPSSIPTKTDFLNARPGRVGSQSLFSTTGSSNRLSSQTGTKDAGGPRSDPVDESGGSLPPQSPSSIPTKTDFLNARPGRVGSQSLFSTTGPPNRLSSRTSTKDADAGGTRSDQVDESVGSLPPQSPSSTLTTETECFETKPGRAGSQSLHSTICSSNELSFELCPTTALSHAKQVTDQPDTFVNKLFSGTDSQQAETYPKAEGQKSMRKIRINLQRGSRFPIEEYLPCSAGEYFEWTHCLMNCSETLKNTLNKAGISLVFLKNKPPVFMIPENRRDFVEPLQQIFRETVKENNITCHLFEWDMSRPEKDFERFCKKWNDTKHYSGVFLSWDIWNEKVTLCLVGEKTQIEVVKPLVVSELQKYANIPCADNADFVTWRTSVKSTIAKIFEKTKESLETEFQVKISFNTDSEIEISANTYDIAQRVFRRVDEMSKYVRVIELSDEHKMLLLRSKKARFFIKTELKKKYELKIHFLQIKRNENDILQVFEENNGELEGIEQKILKNLFYIPSTDRLCKVFISDIGKKLSTKLVEKNDGKVQIVFDKTRQLCCVGTKDVEEKIRNSLAKFLFTKEVVILPSEDILRFCQTHDVFQDIAKDRGCDYQLIEDAECRWVVEVSGPELLVSDCCGNIEEEIKKIKTKAVASIDFSNESIVANLIDKWNAEKRCFIKIRSDKLKRSAPWKKWIEKKGMNRNLIYCVKTNVTAELQEDEFKLVLIPDEISGAKKKNPFEPLLGMAHHVQMFIPCSTNAKIKDIVTTRFKDVLKFNKESWQKESMIVDCDQVPEQELKVSVKMILHTLATAVKSDTCIAKCEFCDTRLNMFDCLTEVIDTHLNKKDPDVFEWKGRSIEVDVQTGQLAQQKGVDVLVNSTSNNLDLNTGLISKSILKAAGPEIQEECNKYKRFKEGEIAVTLGYGLSCKRVFHGAIPACNPKEKSLRSLRDVVRKCLEKADELMMESIAFPALGTGNLGYLHRDVANVLFEEVEAYEKKVKIGSLNRVCCVIYEKDKQAIQEFTRRHLLWKKDHKVQNVQKQVVVTSDKPDVIEEICQELKQSKHRIAALTEPLQTEITNTMRLGKPSTSGGVESNTQRKTTKDSSQLLDNLSEERRCLLVRGKEDFENDVHAWKKRLRNDFNEMAENIVCPFHHPNQALIQFSSENDVAEVIKDRNLTVKYDVRKFPSQAVVGLEAVVSSRMAQLLKQRQITPSEIRSKSGVVVHKKDSNTMVLSGNILEIEAAFTFFSSIVKDASFDIKEIEKDKPHFEGQNIALDHKRNVSGKMDSKMDPRNDDNFRKQHQISEKVPHIPNTQNMNSVSGKEHRKPYESSDSTEGYSTLKMDTSNILKLKCTDEDVFKLKHFFKNLMNNVKETRDPGQSQISLLLQDENTKKKVEGSLQKIKDMPGGIIQLHEAFDGVEDFLAKQCSEDALCYLSKDRQLIEVFVIDRGNLTKFKEDLSRLLIFESQKVKEINESLGEKVYVTNAGISVFVKCTSLLNIGRPVDAIVCPISKDCDIKGGLPKAVADFAGTNYVKVLSGIFEKNDKMFPDEFVCVIPTRNKTCKYVINVTTKQWRRGRKESKACELFLLKQMSQVLFKAEESGIRSIAIPAICSGNCGFPKETCTLCYATSVLMYSRTIRDDEKRLYEIIFVDQSAEMITYMKSVFTQSNVEEVTRMKEQELLKNCGGFYPYFACEGGKLCLSEKLELCVLDSKDLNPNPSKRALVYHDILGKMERSVKEKCLSKDLKKQISSYKGVFFCKQNITEIPNVVFPEMDNPVSENFWKALSTFYFKIFDEADRQNICRMILPFYGSVKGNTDASRKSAECLINELHKFAVRSTSKTAVDIVMPIADTHTRDVMKQEIELYVESERADFHDLSKNKSKLK